MRCPGPWPPHIHALEQRPLEHTACHLVVPSAKSLLPHLSDALCVFSGGGNLGRKMGSMRSHRGNRGQSVGRQWKQALAEDEDQARWAHGGGGQGGGTQSGQPGRGREPTVARCLVLQIRKKMKSRPPRSSRYPCHRSSLGDASRGHSEPT